MSRSFDPAQFEQVYDRLICHGRFNEEPEYYPRYTPRYRSILERFAERAEPAPLDVLDVGGGQLALLTKALWGDRSVAADIGGEHLGYLESVGVSTAAWNLCSDPSPFENRFDVIFFSEVIEHLPLPGHEVLEKLKHAARPGALLICTTPNLYRLRNIAFMLTGRQIFDHFRMPKEHGLGHVLEYSRDHLAWQLDRAGWHDAEIEFVQIPHAPVERMHRVLYRLGSPLFMVPRFRDTLVATARA